MAELVAWVGRNLRRHLDKDSFLEELIERAMIEGVAVLAPGSRGEITGRSTASLPGWVGNLKDVDVKISLPEESQPSILIEAKVDDVDQTLWDLLKLVEAPFVEGAIGGYLAVAAETRRWEGDRDCVALFGDGTRAWSTRKFFSDWPKAWADLKSGGPARLTRAPEEVETKLIARAPVRVFEGYELRCVRVRPLGPPSVRFMDGDPV